MIHHLTLNPYIDNFIRSRKGEKVRVEMDYDVPWVNDGPNSVRIWYLRSM